MSNSVHIGRITIRWIFLLGALIVVGPLASRITSGLTAADGSPYTSLLVGSSLSAGLVAILAVFALTFAIVLPSARLFGPRRAMALACYCLAWASWTTGTIDEIIRSLRAEGDSPVGLLMVEATLVGGFSLLLVLAILRFGRVQSHGPDGLDIRAGKSAPGENLRRLLSRGGMVGLIAAIVAGGLVGWIFAIEPLKGQAVFAAVMAAIAAGAAAQLASIAVAGESNPAPAITPFVALMVLAIASPMVMAMMVDGGVGNHLLASANAGVLFPLGHILPLDWAAGAFLGAPIGLAWARSMIEEGKGASRADESPALSEAT